MSFTTLTFIIFFVSVLVIKLLIQNRIKDKYCTLLLLLCNYTFYSFWDYRFSLLLLFLTISVYYCALRNDKKHYYYGIFLSTLVLCFFKYFNFFLNTIGFESLKIILPLGISFYTFEAIGYLTDVKTGTIKAENDFIVFATYLSFFPNIASGPIARASNLLAQIKENKKTTICDIRIGIQIITIGFFKKMVIADRLGVFVNDVYARPSAFNWHTTLLAVLSYSIQIYMDFSGYSDIAIGCAKCLGYNFDKNFDLPYISNSFTEFWRRWHISLSTWFRDYVYIPLGGNRKGTIRKYFNLMIVMALSGLWHGANWNYLIWGLINGVLLCVEKRINIKRDKNILNIVVTYILISFTWIFFRAESFSVALTIIKSIITFKDGINQPYLWSIFSFIITLVVTYIIYKKQRNNEYNNYLIQDLDTIKGLVILFVLIGLTICLAYTNTSPFVYFSF